MGVNDTKKREQISLSINQLIGLLCSNSNRRLTLTNNTLLTQTRLIMELCTASVTTWGAFTSPSFYSLSLLFIYFIFYFFFL